MAPKLKLKPKPKYSMPEPLMYSGYALTDNRRFVLFDINQQFVLDNFIQDDILGFNFSEDMVDMQIDRNVSLHPIKKGNQVVFETFGVVEEPIFDLVLRKAPNGTFMPVIKWFGESVNSLVCCLSDNGKPAAVVKTF